MTDKQAILRQQFEDAYVAAYPTSAVLVPALLQREDDGQYAHMQVQTAWTLYCAALAAQAVPADVVRTIRKECRRLRMTTDGRRHAEAHAFASWVHATLALAASPARAEAKEGAKCCSCGAILTANELHYYGSTCEQCEGAAMAAIEAELSTPQPQAAQPVGKAGTMPGTPSGFTMACFKAVDVPVGTKLYTAAPEEQTQAARDVLAERQRQISAEGWAPERDDEHHVGALPHAAAMYAIYGNIGYYGPGNPPSDWPWATEWWKPSADHRRNLIKAGALILAEIERLDRAALRSAQGGE